MRRSSPAMDGSCGSRGMPPGRFGQPCGGGLYRLMGLGATIAAAMLVIADYLLEYSREFRLTSRIVEPVWAAMPEWRFLLSINLCAFFIPFYLCGFWLLYRLLREGNRVLAAVIFGLFSYGTVMGSPLIHTVISLFPLIYQYGLANGLDARVIEALIAGRITGAILPVFIAHYLLTWIAAPVLLFAVVIKGRTALPRWAALANPLLFLLAGLAGLALWPGLFAHLAPGSINKANALLFLIVTVRTWKIEA